MPQGSFHPLLHCETSCRACSLLQIYNTDGSLLKSWSVATEGKHTWTPETDGKYKFCFGNQMARWTPKWVSFYLSQGVNPNLAKIGVQG